MPFAVKLQCGSTSHVLRGLADDIDFEAFGLLVAEKSGILPECQVLIAGFPPLQISHSSAADKVSQYVPSGSVIKVGKREQRVFKPDEIVAYREGESSVAAKIVKIHHDDVDLYYTIELENGTEKQTAGSRVCALTQENARHFTDAFAKPSPSAPVGRACPACTFLNEPAVECCSCCGTKLPSTKAMVRRVVNADNSCLFTALGYLLEGKQREKGRALRQVISDIIGDNEEGTFTSAFLERSLPDYQQWIQSSSSGGGAIELSILSKYYEKEMVAVDIKTGNSYCYGEGQSYQERVYLIYDGIHYDALALATSNEAAEKEDITIFASTDKDAHALALEFARKCKENSKFVDPASFSLKCLVCGTGLVGQEDAQAHAQQTGHQNFGQV
jgi:ubiquitin thioesterase OTU1